MARLYFGEMISQTHFLEAAVVMFGKQLPITT